MTGLRFFGAAGGAIFAVLTLIAFAIAPGPSSANGVTVLDYYAAHGTATLSQAGLVGIGAVCFIWFAEVFARELSVGPTAVVGAAVTGALYLVTVGCWEVIAEIYGGVDTGTVTSEDYSDAHVFYDVGTGAAHMAHFTATAFVGSHRSGDHLRGKALALARVGRFRDDRCAPDQRHDRARIGITLVRRPRLGCICRVAWVDLRDEYLAHRCDSTPRGRRPRRSRVTSVRRHDQRDRCRWGLLEGLTDTLAGACCVGVAVELPDEFAAVLVAEVERDIARVKLEHVPGVPAEVVAARRV